MDTVVVIIVVIAAVVIAAGVVAYLYQRRRTSQLQEQFGPEYDRTLEETGDRRSTERELHARQKRVSQFDVHPIAGEAAERYRQEWNELQGRFVDEPSGAVNEADSLVMRMMREAGYPVDDFDQRADDISVRHPEVAQNYRMAHRIAELNSQGQADTEELRQAVAAYRRLVDVLLDEGTADRSSADRSPASADRSSADPASADGEPGDREPAVRSDRTEQV